ncbi:hypothetical protein ATO6_02630 [Oceanicola sp. 22II-s10i]|uniref:TRAP transporter small permease n=1 Tax=Oceanicola sp. 22II-s10i TaxID=1317116 RepID=UPI000B5251EE|nr:TRAP transporter small permease [Oceanicola sp. 22II-s10i]OWU85819.1 hypothetical protein ATO6_02630 [Oceanicola sp. 22II-s10i]
MTRPGSGIPFPRGRFRLIGQAIHGLTEIGLWIAMTGLALIVVAYNYEVVTRYAFGAPTRWSAELVSYLLLIVAFLALPRLTRDGGHVAVTVLLERLPLRGRVLAGQAIAVLGAVICLVMAWIAGEETLRQASRGVRMMAAIPVPKAVISVWIVWGLGLSAAQFLMLAIAAPDPAAEVTAP